MPDGGGVHRSATIALSAAMIVIGVVMLARTLAAGGGPLALGTILGLLFVAAGGARMWLARRGA